MAPRSSRPDDWPVLLHEELTKHISNAFLQVFHELGCGFAESVYATALECVLTECGLRVEREVPISVYFHGRRIGSFKADMIVESAVMVEIKAMRRPDPSFEAQLLNYLRATSIEVGLLLYFNPKPLKRRLIYTNDRKLIP
jgi:GxxExxY protein